MIAIPGFEQRMDDELTDLLNRIRECANALDNQKIPKDQRILMMQQLSHMTNYAATLATRIEWL